MKAPSSRLHLGASRAEPRELSSRRQKNLQFRLLRWYAAAQRKLPWRKTRDAYGIWVSEVMLQQTQTAKVLYYYERFLQQFPSVLALATARLDEVLKAWEGMGYYARARNLHKAAQHLVRHWHGNLPSHYSQLLQIHGIGPYTAAAVASIAFNRNHAVVDGNVERVLSRIFLIHLVPKSSAGKKVFQQCAENFLWHGRARVWNQALMELGALVCTPKNPHCEACPAQNYCRAHLELDNPAVMPQRVRAAPRPHHHIAVGVIRKNRRLLIDQRPENGLLGGLWEFPGGKIEAGETPERALRREIYEELALEVAVGKKLMEIEHGYTHYSITLHVYHCHYVRGTPQARGCQAWKWVQKHELKKFAFPTVNRKIIDALLQEA